jgi:hypothetical protein
MKVNSLLTLPSGDTRVWTATSFIRLKSALASADNPGKKLHQMPNEIIVHLIQNCPEKNLKQKSTDIHCCYYLLCIKILKLQDSKRGRKKNIQQKRILCLLLKVNKQQMFNNVKLWHLQDKTMQV